MRFPTMWHVGPAKPQISLRICPKSHWATALQRKSLKFKNIYCSGGSRGVQGVCSNPPPHPLFINILWIWNNLVSVRPNYFSETKLFQFHGIFKKTEIKSVKWIPTPLYIWTHFPEIQDLPLYCICPFGYEENNLYESLWPRLMQVSFLHVFI